MGFSVSYEGPAGFMRVVQALGRLKKAQGRLDEGFELDGFRGLKSWGNLSLGC